MTKASFCDEIHIEDLEVYANHGVFPEETKLGQRFLVSLTMYVNTRHAGRTDCLEHSINYGDVCAFITRYMKENTYKLIEAAAENLAEALFRHYSLLHGVTLELKKPWAPIGLPLKTVSVKITRFWHTAYIGLGSNLGDKKGYLDQAVKSLNERSGCHVEKVSSYLVTEPYGGVEQDDFLNACLILKTLLSPQELLESLHEIEQDAHRERIVHWGPRTLDLDILMYDDEILETDDLIIPHVEMHLRDFVLKPLQEIAPNKRHPVYQKTMTQLLNGLK
ncbi:2-amino-4-hydroxy-6-hydroxymethyldihydropteridine diphosphokinase [[Clostridium] symbiosum]|uniref:2-amino-4-hydroxy-6- hydroxymethyldihydropteridine diphosphokinase n=1 Tax=Clostridium symbiosum TaxID=1512 RepID=UPI001D06C715|nr:2-amino-4-hydroxy-6-hydroxymethyldihydropteridine diphosphokinase [[Clostridium] symbiosum]MCB6609640.1 2-amino-4-hydroxy-6-hydroxymethyldihydropteridine diphosphokinase [[Clostridium] symbiosum]MCB6933118.1 2-amino-4-hydroxy-6-hydroxymethyldihydropteridine diphosphokinase [[Clostridium] symbiosum]